RRHCTHRGSRGRNGLVAAASTRTSHASFLESAFDPTKSGERKPASASVGACAEAEDLIRDEKDGREAAGSPPLACEHARNCGKHFSFAASQTSASVSAGFGDAFFLLRCPASLRHDPNPSQRCSERSRPAGGNL